MEKFRYLKDKNPEVSLYVSIKIDNYDNGMNNAL